MRPDNGGNDHTVMIYHSALDRGKATRLLCRSIEERDGTLIVIGDVGPVACFKPGVWVSAIMQPTEEGSGKPAE